MADAKPTTQAPSEAPAGQQQIQVNVDYLKTTRVHICMPCYGGMLTESTFMSFIKWANTARQLGIGMVYQHFTVVPGMTVAENLLLRGGYRKTHFQADQTTLQNVSQMGITYKDSIEHLKLSSPEEFVPKFSLEKEFTNMPNIFPFIIIGQAASLPILFNPCKCCTSVVNIIN